MKFNLVIYFISSSIVLIFSRLFCSSGKKFTIYTTLLPGLRLEEVAHSEQLQQHNYANELPTKFCRCRRTKHLITPITQLPNYKIPQLPNYFTNISSTLKTFTLSAEIIKGYFSISLSSSSTSFGLGD